MAKVTTDIYLDSISTFSFSSLDPEFNRTNMAPLYFLSSLISPQIPSAMVSHSLRRANGTSPNPILNPNNTDQSSLQNITISIIGIFIALGSFVLAYLQYRRSIQSPSHAPGLGETENTISFDSKLPFPMSTRTLLTAPR